MLVRVKTHDEAEISEDKYAEMLNDTLPEVTVGRMSWGAGDVLREMDPIAFRCGIADEQMWQCTECGNEYDDESEAEECCPRWDCDVCGVTTDDEDDECCEDDND